MHETPVARGSRLESGLVRPAALGARVPYLNEAHMISMAGQGPPLAAPGKFSASRKPCEMKFKLPTNIHAALLLLLGVILCAIAACRPGEKLPAKASKEYDEVVRAFYVGLAALQGGDDVRADSKLAQVTQLVAGEPAGWANWGMLALRQRNFDPASERLERARTLAPENDQAAGRRK